MSGSNHMPPGGIRALLASDAVTAPTRAALQAKLDRHYPQPRFFDPDAYRTLQAVCARLVPQPPPAPVDIAGAFDERLADGKRNGWRYDTMPPDDEAARRGLAGVDETAHALFGDRFTQLTAEQRDEVLHAIQSGQPLGATWTTLPADRWFEELLVEVTEIYFAHPLAQEAIDYIGMADAQGWTAVRLNEDEPGTHAPV